VRIGRLFGVSVTALILVPPAVIAGETVIYKYDELGRLVKTTQTGTINNGVETDIAYDPAGNRTHYDVTGSNGAGDPGGTGATGGGNGSGGGGSGGGTETPPSFSVSDASGVEGSTPLTFTITKTGTVQNSYSVNYATTGSSAVAGDDFAGVSGTMSFTGAETQKTVAINTINDTVGEDTEVFHLNLSVPTGGSTITDPQGAGTISDDGDSTSQPPVTTPDVLTMDICDFYKDVDVVDNDTDPEGNYPLALISENSPNASVLNSRKIRYGPPPNIGSYTVNYVVQDNTGAQSTGVLHVTVNPGNCFQ